MNLERGGMGYDYLDLLATPSVQAAQTANGARTIWDRFDGDRVSDRFAENEAAFIADPGLAARLVDPNDKGRPERGFVLRLQAFDWNCPQHITRRFTGPEIETVLGPMRRRIEALEMENRELRAQLG